MKSIRIINTLFTARRRSARAHRGTRLLSSTESAHFYFVLND